MKGDRRGKRKTKFFRFGYPELHPIYKGKIAESLEGLEGNVGMFCLYVIFFG